MLYRKLLSLGVKIHHALAGTEWCRRRLGRMLLAAGLTLWLLTTAGMPASAQDVSLGDGTWAWQNPLPQGNALYSMTGVNANHVWAVGYTGAILMWDGNHWVGQDSGVATALNGVWAADKDNVWAVGIWGIILKWDGSRWNRQSSGIETPIYAVWGADASNVWAVGEWGIILKWDGSQWSRQSSGIDSRLYAVWGLDANNVWAAGADGVMLKWDGVNWSSQMDNESGTVRSIWGTSADNLWAVGDSGLLLKWDGGSWSGQTPQWLNESDDGRIGLRSVWGTDTNNVWAVGEFGRILKWDGNSWSLQSSGARSHLYAVWGVDANHVWAVGDSGVSLSWDGSNWYGEDDYPKILFLDFWSADANNVWVVSGLNTILKWNGSSWSIQNSGGYKTLYGVWGLDPNNIWAVGGLGTILKWNGSSWISQSSGVNKTLYGVWGTDVSHMWIVGTMGTVLKWDGSSWGTQNVDPNTSFYGVWGTDASNVWIVGDQGAIYNWNGSNWSKQTTGVRSTLNDVWGLDADHVWAVGEDGTIVMWNGSSWETQSSGAESHLQSLAGLDANNVWAVGGDGTIVKWNGSSWSSRNTGTITSLFSIRSIDANSVWAIGGLGVILRAVRYPLQVTGGHGSISSDSGGINCGGVCSAAFDKGTVVTLTALADVGYSFAGWSGDASGPDNPLVLTIDGSKSITAAFTLNSYPLRVSKSNGGKVTSESTGIDCGTSCTNSYSHGTVVTLTALADSGYSFAGWSGGASGTDNPLVLTIDGSKSITANFTRNSYVLSVSKSGGGKISSTPAGIDCGASCAADFGYGEIVMLAALADDGYSFTGWDGACSGLDACRIAMDDAKEVTAAFIQLHGPQAQADVAATLAGETLLIDVLANDLRGDSPSLALHSVAQPASGGAAAVEDNQVRFTPSAGYSGAATFIYTVEDGNGLTGSAAVAVTVAAQEESRDKPQVLPLLNPAAGSVVTVTTSGGSTIIQLPAGAINDTGQPLALVYSEIVTPIPPPPAAQFAGRTFVLTLFDGAQPQPGYRFAKPILLTLSYDPMLVADASKIIFYYYDEASGQWSGDGIALVDVDESIHTVTISVAHLTLFAMLFPSAPVDVEWKLYLPEVTNKVS